MGNDAPENGVLGSNGSKLPEQTFKEFAGSTIVPRLMRAGELHSIFPPCAFKIAQAWLIACSGVSPEKSKSVFRFG